MQVSGVVLRAHQLFLHAQTDEDRARVMDALVACTRQATTKGFLETRWYPYEILLDLSTTIDHVLGQGDRALCEQIGRNACDIALGTINRLLLKFGNLNHLIDRAATAWRTQFDSGEVIVRGTQDTRVVVEIRGIAQPNAVHCALITGWILRATELSGEEGIEYQRECRAEGDSRCAWTFHRSPSLAVEI